MPIQSGTATDSKDMLEQLRVFALANGWVAEAYVTDPDPEVANELYLRGLGSTDTENVHVNIRTTANVFDSEAGWEFRCATEYDGAQLFDLQPFISPAVFLCTSLGTMNYWFYLSDRRIIVVNQIATSFFSAYAGFFLPFATPIEYPFPLYLGATTNGRIAASDFDTSFRNFIDPGIFAAYVRDPDGAWSGVFNHDSSGIGNDRFRDSSNTASDYFISPYNTCGVQAGQEEMPGNWDVRPPPGDPNAVMLYPPHISSQIYRAPNLGILENCFWMNGFGKVSDQSFNLGTEVATGTLTFTGAGSDGDTISIGFDLAAVGRLTAPSVNFSDGDTVTIDAKTYTFQTVLTNVDGNVLIGPDAITSLAYLVAAINLDAGGGTTYAAATTIHPTVSAAVNANNSRVLDATAKTAGSAGNAIALAVTGTAAIWGGPNLEGGEDPTVYTLRTSIGGVSPANEVLIGADLTETRDNLQAAINKAAGEGVRYSFGTVFNNDVTADAVSTDQLLARAREFGADGNAITTTETSADASWGGATLSGGGGTETYRIFQNVARTEPNHFFAVLEI